MCTPRMAYEALESLLKTLNRILKQFHHPDVNREIISIHDEAVALQLQLHLQNNPESFEDRIREIANTTQGLIEDLISEASPFCDGWKMPTEQHLKQLRKAGQDFKSTALPKSDRVNGKRRRQDDINPSRITMSTSKDVVVGFNGDLDYIIDRIRDSHPYRLQVLSILGMGGTGKTTLAKLVYNHEFIKTSFPIRAWIKVSFNYNVGSIHSNLLASLEKCIPIQSRDGCKNIPMESLIRKYLQRRRFLVVIDDMWSQNAWDDLKVLFPDSDSGSCVMLTTRLRDVATYVDASGPVHTMRSLNVNDSWKLLKKKVFVDESCPPELEDIGRKIVKNCGGLPLSIVVEAGILSKLPKTRKTWEQIASNHGNLEARISLSYSYLPSYMKACFLYIGGFPEDYEMRVSELVKLWIGEGFLKCPTGSISLEEEAEKVLENLDERNLILVGERKLSGKIKSCSLHDLVRDFCIRQAGKEKLFLSVMDYLPSPILRNHFLPRLLKCYDRISATCHDLDLKDSTHSSLTHSIICIPQRGYRCRNFMHKFNSLRVFHVLRKNENWEWKPSGVFDQIYLTYLASNIPTSIVPPAISKLQNLQTLNIYRAEVVLPPEIWMLRKLRNLMVFSFYSVPHPDTTTLPLENLQTMSSVIDSVCGRMIKMMPNIKKLGICYFKFDGGYQIYNLRHLRQLENLKLEGSERFTLWELDMPGNLLEKGSCLNSFFPLSLKKLTLCDLRIPWRDMTNIGSLPNLQVLKLRNCGCGGKYWKTIQCQFGELRLLLIDGSNLKYWNPDDSNFQRLERLIIRNCPNLSAIPFTVMSVPTLEFIEINGRHLINFLI